MASSNNWYVVNVSGETQGPMDQDMLIKMFLREEIHSRTYIWDGMHIKEWLPIKEVPFIYDKIKHHYIYYHDDIGDDDNDEQATSAAAAAFDSKKMKAKQIESSDGNDIEMLETVKSFKSLFQTDSQQNVTPINPKNTARKIKSVANRSQSVPATAASSSPSNRNGTASAESSDEVSQTINYPHISNNKAKPAIPAQNRTSVRSHHANNNSERMDFLANIQNGIRLKDVEDVRVQIQRGLAPKRVKDPFVSSASTQSRQSYTSTADEGERATSRQKRPTRAKTQSPYKVTRAKQNSAPGRLPFIDGELQQKAKKIRKQYGDADVAYSVIDKSEQSQSASTSPDHNSYGKKPKSQHLSNRIEKIKFKMDKLTDNESWVVTRIENLLSTAISGNR
eukprot:CAMPEP_0202717510 /NCGR_PEP_ID=MMETSP1385-20130828/112530_1 /ASSEMBLY_ACC=CAM_ASM_000861 /TAXON_ID=933848 /ORGANISM="Elphidium margaritaceum" /LENGTH=392 /DNA_ID=CAMNT_0049379789 /DNA_START=23 /DNA_END=1201 /DNA_ORIENTATION=+